MHYGNTGKVLEVDLTSGQVEVLELDEDIYKQYIGGTGLAAKLLFDRGDLDAGPLDPEALFIVATGPMAGTAMYGTSRLSVGARSPLTDIWGQASCGGDIGPELKRCSYDAIIFKGKAAEPVYLLIEEENASLEPAGDLWGKDTYVVDDELKAKHSKLHKIMVIGPAGENGVLFGSISNSKGHHFGRSGMGTVMGSKNLKAICAKGGKKSELADPEGFKTLWQDTLRPQMDESIYCQTVGAFGTAANMEMKMIEGDVPTKNFQVGSWEEGPETLSGIAMSDTILTGRDTCRGCGIRCKRVVKIEEGPYAIEEGPGPEYETIGTFGTMMMNPNLEVVAKANDMCNRLGMDTMTCGSTIAWAMDCFDRGMMKPEDYDGVKLEWGVMDPVLDLIEKIANKEGKLGELLAKGSAKAAAEVGNGSEALLTTSKGLESPMHDPRGNWGDGLAYATSVRGACHVSNLMFLLEWGAMEYPEIGVDHILDPMGTEYKADGAAKMHDLGCITNSACWCQFPSQSLTLPQWVEVFNLVTGWGWDIDEFMKTGGRIWYLQRCLGHIWGATAEDDKLGERSMFATEDGMIAGSVPDMETMLKEFYELRGLGPDGKPSSEVLEGYGLGYLADKL
jgi:aldehyde:ferredoxin oxidoreductase